MAKETFAKICKGSFDPASPYGCAVTMVATWLVPPQLYAKAEKRSPFADRSEDALTVLRIFEITSVDKKKLQRGSFPVLLFNIA